MGIVDRLLETSRVFAHCEPDVAAEAKEAADIITRLKGYANHEPNCPVSYGATDDQCLCGLSALLEEIDRDRD